jgi:hypothetical protein
MTNENLKMSGPYKAVLAFSIAMSVLMFISYSAEYQTTHKASSTGLAFLIWCYQSWLIFKQQNAKLIGFYKAMLWIGGIALTVLGLMFLNNSEIALYGFDDAKLIGLVVMMVIYYGLLKFFTQQLINPPVINPTLNNANASDDDYLRAEVEFNSDLRDAGLWARCFAEADGNEVIAKARYIKSRAIQSSTSGISAQSTVNNVKFEQSSEKELIEKLSNTKNLLIAETTILLMILIAAGYFAMPVNKDKLVGLIGIGGRHELELNEMLVKPTQNPNISTYEVRGPDDSHYSIDGPVGADRNTVIDVIKSRVKNEDKAKWKDFK